MARILVLFAHPALEKSRVHRRLVRALPPLAGLTFHDLYEAYPAFDIDVEREQRLVVDHDGIIFQHPFYWYSTPAILKQWEDLVLEHGWAYGSRGTALRGKWFLNVVTAGGGAAAYQAEGLNGHTVRELLAPVEQTARLCGMRYLPPYVIHGTHRLDADGIDHEAAGYAALLRRLHDDRLDLDAVARYATLNDALARVAAGDAA
ncbi:MAG TPA: NAD(P)H-dependent oxidoreductase [Gemmatimonadaceae bacterium]|nr:NAD(P)H-dependent oxidoreductase [Gemmatimonadaceae bacterium]